MVQPDPQWPEAEQARFDRAITDRKLRRSFERL
jgi:hypothetical protein